MCVELTPPTSHAGITAAHLLCTRKRWQKSRGLSSRNSIKKCISNSWGSGMQCVIPGETDGYVCGLNNKELFAHATLTSHIRTWTPPIPPRKRCPQSIYPETHCDLSSSHNFPVQAVFSAWDWTYLGCHSYLLCPWLLRWFCSAILGALLTSPISAMSAGDDLPSIWTLLPRSARCCSQLTQKDWLQSGFCSAQFTEPALCFWLIVCVVKMYYFRSNFVIRSSCQFEEAALFSSLFFPPTSAYFFPSPLISFLKSTQWVFYCPIAFKAD